MCDNRTIHRRGQRRGKTLTVYNEDEPEPLVRMLRRMVDAPAVDVREGRQRGIRW
ncbi:hypothetical protein ACFQH8_08575 [Halomicroarcula sp. GCM10025710]